MAKYKVRNTLFPLLNFNPFPPYLYAVLVHRLDKIENLITFPQESLHEGRGLGLLAVRGSHEVDVLLLLLHSLKVLLQASQSCGIIA